MLLSMGFILDDIHNCLLRTHNSYFDRLSAVFQCREASFDVSFFLRLHPELGANW